MPFLRPLSMPSHPSQRGIARAIAGLLLACCLASGAAEASERASLIHTPPVGARAGRALELEGTLLSGTGVERLIIRYRVDGESWREAPMDLAFGDLFRGSIPGSFLTHGRLEYHIEGVQLRGQRVPVFASRDAPARVELEGGRAPRAPEPAARAPETTRNNPPARAVEDARRTDPRELSAEELEWRALEAQPKTPPEQPRPARRAGRTASDRESPAPVPEVRRAPEPAPEPPARRQPADDGDWARSGVGADPTRSERPRASTPAVSRASRTPLEDELAVYAATDEAALARIHPPSAITTLQPTYVLTRSDLQRLGVRRVHEALEYIPGLAVTRDVQGYWRTAIRGLRGDAEVLFVRDGIRLNNAWDGRALADLPVENLERIEITLGPGAARFGGPAVLGIIELVTRTDPGVRGAIAGGSFGTFDGHANGATKLGPVELRADLDVLGQEGYRAELATDEIAELTEAQGLRRVGQPVGFTDDRRFLVQGGVSALLELPGGGSLNASARVYHEERGVLAAQFNTAANTDPEGDDPSRIGSLGLFGQVDWRQPMGEALTLRAGLWAQQQSSQRLYQLAPDGYMTSADPASAFLLGVRDQQDFGVRDLGVELAVEVELGKAHQVSVGVRGGLQQLTEFAYLTNYDLSGLPLGGMERALVGTDADGAPVLLPYPQELGGGVAARRLGGSVWAEDRWQVLERLEVDAALRVEAWELPVADGQGGFSGTRWVPSLNPRLGLAMQLSDPLVLRAGWARAFRAPTMSELTEVLPHRNIGFGRGRAYGNPGLQPVNVDTFSASADLLQSAGFSRIRLRGEAFFSYLSGAITMVDRTGSDNPWTNRTAVRVFGAEGEMAVEVSERARAFLNVSMSRAEDLDTPAGFRLLTDVAQARFAAGASVPVGSFLNLDLSARLGAERRNTARSELELLRRFAIPGYGLVTAQLRTEPIFGHLEAVLLGQNLMDARVTDDVPRSDRMTGLLPREGFSAFLLVRGWL